MKSLEDIYNNQIRSFDDIKAFALSSKERINEIYDALVLEASNDANIEANTSSKTGKWRLWIFLFAFFTWVHEVVWLAFKLELDDAATYAQSHTLAWYRQKVLEYQDGDSLTVVDGAVTYDPINPDNRIIAAASVKETLSGALIIKAAKQNGLGDLVPLSAQEKTGLEAYVSDFQDAGVLTSVVSQNPDVLKLEATVYYLPGVESENSFKTRFESAVETYLKNLTFDGVFRRIKLIDELQQLEAFHDIDIAVLQASVAYTVTANFQDINLEYESVAGYMQVDSNFQLDSTITYEAYN